MSTTPLDTLVRRGLMSFMRERLFPALPALRVALQASTVAAQTPLRLRWELVGDSITNDQAASSFEHPRSTKPNPELLPDAPHG
jgi:hypothetical protein